ncbi:hypothetical protein D3Z35_15405 [Enterococcus faecalis]|jgi:septal ring factor EnvC (AmiA/AmiB activator)|uniref:hypothetical protein n=1 Tax=Enterococcus faecalis TaxID=1351 RepID=UPI00080C6478|nr:hypothetical protein [Enterococcus faecalis]ANU71981.1 hypothetical protein A4V06_02445 [Enterococcus faecalis]ASU26680.1 hypothetical protein ADH73_11790 [Enterococcus faecalis]EGO8196908.1 hypothetical protein [Enterococcus faecalis]MBX8941985.1 hypothetical protein [Enterococcus faecalis]MCR1938321.1 hypothetical protein [Enterococcus faecalis]
MSQSKIEKLREKLNNTMKKREVLNGTIKKLQEQISEEEVKVFRSTMEEMDLTLEEAVKRLKESEKQVLPSFSSIQSTINQENNLTKENEHGVI